MPGETPKKWKRIEDRVAFFNLRAGDEVRITSGPPALLWEGVAEREAGGGATTAAEAEAEVVGAEPSLEPKVWKIKSIDRRNALVKLDGLSVRPHPLPFPSLLVSRFLSLTDPPSLTEPTVRAPADDARPARAQPNRARRD